MRIWSLFLLMFVLMAIAIGSNFAGTDVEFQNLTEIIDDFNVSTIDLHEETYDNTYTSGVVKILEYYIKFVAIAGLEVMKLGMQFGFDNPDYFESDFILKVIYGIIWLVLIILLIKPVTYLIILIALFFIWMGGVIKKMNKRKAEIAGRK